MKTFMNKMKFSIPILIAGLLFINDFANAQNMQVSGAGTPAEDGIYEVAGKYDGVNYYQKGSLKLYLWRITLPGTGGYWSIGTQVGNMALPTLYYYKPYVHPLYPHATPDGVLFNRTGDLGSESFPSVADTPLPVELTSFRANISSNGVDLSWETAMEVNNYGFEVQRSISNVQIQNWQMLGFVEGYGNSNSPKKYYFIDVNVTAGIYSYRLKQIDFDGTLNYSPEIEVDVNEPTEFSLFQNYPNPFNPCTIIKFALPEKTDLIIAVYNSLGEKVAEAFRGEVAEGYHEVNFDASNLSSGLYFYRFESRQIVAVKKMLLIK